MGQKIFMGQKILAYFKKAENLHFYAKKKWAFVPFLSRILSHKFMVKIAQKWVKMAVFRGFLVIFEENLSLWDKRTIIYNI